MALITVVGTHNRLGPEDKHVVKSLLTNNTFKRLHTFQVGARAGIEVYAAEVLQSWGAAHVRAIVPYDRKHVDSSYQRYADEIVEMPLGSDYTAHNQALLVGCDYLMAFPEYPEDDVRARRAWTWMTIRMARQLEIPGMIYMLRTKNVLHVLEGVQ